MDCRYSNHVGCTELGSTELNLCESLSQMAAFSNHRHSWVFWTPELASRFDLDGATTVLDSTWEFQPSAVYQRWCYWGLISLETHKAANEIGSEMRVHQRLETEPQRCTEKRIPYWDVDRGFRPTESHGDHPYSQNSSIFIFFLGEYDEDQKQMLVLVVMKNLFCKHGRKGIGRGSEARVEKLLCASSYLGRWLMVSLLPLYTSLYYFVINQIISWEISKT